MEVKSAAEVSPPGLSGSPSAQGAMEFIRPGITFDELENWVGWRIQTLGLRARRHDGASLRWRTIAGPLAWLAAVFAALSGLSVVTDNQDYAQALSVATAVIAATNAAVNPAEIARRHRAASLAYVHLANKVSDMQFFEVGAGWGDRGKKSAVPAEQLRSSRERLNRFDEEKQALDEGAPPLGPRLSLKRYDTIRPLP